MKNTTTDWDKKELLLEARKEWANMTNNLLRKRGIDEQITEKSHKELGKKELPTIHEGVLSRKLEERGIVTNQVQHNQLVREHNQSVQKLNDLEEKKELLIDQEQQPTNLTIFEDCQEKNKESVLWKVFTES
ncbi:MobA/MobL family protein [Enterococcus faecium]|nr:MobA/MobL family protein [Enterococcus faecium]EME3544056.1 MobA/MobL family protein [Enterococcus faecium]